MVRLFAQDDCFNTQPPEGGWLSQLSKGPTMMGFNTQPPEGGWRVNSAYNKKQSGFNTQPPEGGWVLHEDVVKYLTEFQHTAA